MDVTPPPGFAALQGSDHRVPCLVEMGERMGVLRVLAASDMTTGEAYAKLIPRCPERKTFLTAIRARMHIPDVIEVFARLGHDRKSASGR
jgi:hypothetical protein